MSKGKSPVTPKDIGDCLARIAEATDLFGELQKIGADIRQIAYLICIIQYHDSLWRSILQDRSMQKDKIDDGLKKIRERHPDPAKEEKERFKRLKSYTLQVSRMKFMENNAAFRHFLHQPVIRRTYKKTNRILVSKYPTKKRPYLGLDVCCLEAALKPYTSRPYRYIAGLFNAFNMRPERACSGCLEEENGKCKNLSNILSQNCLHTTRRALWQIARQTKKLNPHLVERIM